MKKNVLAEKIFESVAARILEGNPDPAILGGMQVTADGEIVVSPEQFLEFAMTPGRAAKSDRAAHRLNREQAADIACEQGFEVETGIVLGIAMRAAQQPVEIGIALLVSGHQGKCLLLQQRQPMIFLQVYLGAVIQYQAAVPALLPQVFEFTISACQPIGAVEVVDAQRGVAERVGALDQVARVRGAVQKAEVGLAEPFVEIAEHDKLATVSGIRPA